MPLKASLPDVNNWGYDSHWIYGLLTPFSFFYSLGVRARTLAYKAGVFKAKRLPCFTISVGNLTLGGTGKTPFVIGLSNFLTELGLRVAVLSRGYKRKSSKPLIVSVGNGPEVEVEEAGDEPYLIALKTRAMVAVGKDRARAFELLAPHKPHVAILDDGFQHLRIARDLDFCLVDATRCFGNKRLFPAGPLREPTGSLKRADAVVLTRAKRVACLTETKGVLQRLPVFFYTTKAEISGGTPRKATVVCAVSNPRHVVETARAMGVEVTGCLSFKDHHWFKEEDIEGIDGCIITTEKDLVRFPKGVLEKRDIRVIRLKEELPGELRSFVKERLWL